MRRLQIELSDELGKYVEFIPQADLNAMFEDMLWQRINGETQPVVIQAQPTSTFNEDKFFSKLEAMLAERTVAGAAPLPKSKEEIKETFKTTVITAKETVPVDAQGDEVIQDFLLNIFK